MNVRLARYVLKEYFVGNKAKGRILKRVLQEKKAQRIFYIVLLPTISRTRGNCVCTYRPYGKIFPDFFKKLKRLI